MIPKRLYLGCFIILSAKVFSSCAFILIKYKCYFQAILFIYTVKSFVDVWGKFFTRPWARNSAMTLAHKCIYSELSVIQNLSYRVHELSNIFIRELVDLLKETEYIWQKLDYNEVDALTWSHLLISEVLYNYKSNVAWYHATKICRP